MLTVKQSLDVFQVIGPGRGGQIEVLITWQERILQIGHYAVGPRVTIGSKTNINLPLGTMVRNFNLIESHAGQAYVNLPFETKNILQKDNQQIQLTETTYRLQQNEVVFISFRNNIHLAVRFAPLTKQVTLAPMLFSASEYTAMLSALILTSLTSLIVSILSPKIKKEDEFSGRVVQVMFEPPQQVVIAEEKIVQETIQKPKIMRPKVKKSVDNLDVSKMGLVSVLSTEGIRKKMDQANAGSAELIGIGEAATGTSEVKDNQSGDDLGKKFKNTGVGGAGTATVGILYLKTDRAGLGVLGQETDFGVKEPTGITIGGGEENFIGTIDRAAVRRAVQSHLPAIKHCYEREYKMNSRLEGKVVIAWEIHKTGLAENVRVVGSESTMNNHVVEQCVRSVIETIRFPEPPEGAVVEVTGFPFVFSGMK